MMILLSNFATEHTEYTENIKKAEKGKI